MMHFQTPDWCCQMMADKIPPLCGSVLEPTPGEGNLVRAIESKGFSVTAPSEFWEVDGRFDCIVMNPPFTPMSEGYKILFRCMEMSDTVIALMPWLTLINSERRTAAISDYGLRSVTHLPRRTFQGSRVQCCIMHMTKGYTGVTNLGVETFPKTLV
jgi:hypothetical protein